MANVLCSECLFILIARIPHFIHGVLMGLPTFRNCPIFLLAFPFETEWVFRGFRVLGQKVLAFGYPNT